MLRMASDSARGWICNGDRRRRLYKRIPRTNFGRKSIALFSRLTAPILFRWAAASPSISGSGPAPWESKATTRRIRSTTHGRSGSTICPSITWVPADPAARHLAVLDDVVVYLRSRVHRQGEADAL